MAKTGRNGKEPDIKGRLKGLRAELKRRGLEALIVSDIKNIRYLSGFTGSSAYIIVTENKGFFLTDSRYATQAGSEVKGFKIKIYKKALEEITGLISGLKIKTLGFEGGNLSYDTYRKIKRSLGRTHLKSASGAIGALRVRKDPFELRRILDSIKVLDLGFKKAERILAPGVVEKEAALAIERAFEDAGGDALAFGTIIASGPRGALPHGKASDKKIKKGELVVVDMGVLLNGYNSDETRTYCIGKATELQKKIYLTVKEAQEKALTKIRPGVKAVEVDAAARSHIEKAGYGKYFGHGLGHGVGLEIHEGPSLSPFSKDVLAEGMVVTVEPGIYVPDWGGVRIEDMALVVKDGCEVLTKTSKDFVCL